MISVPLIFLFFDVVLQRMEGLIDLVVETDLKTNNEDVKLPFDWVAISSHLFGTCMVHKVINNQVKMPHRSLNALEIESLLVRNISDRIVDGIYCMESERYCNLYLPL